MTTAIAVAKSAHFVSTVTFSLQLHMLHSKARTSRPSGPNTKPVNLVRGISGMAAVSHTAGFYVVSCGRVRTQKK
jgi:hypothetical protein